MCSTLSYFQFELVMKILNLKDVKVSCYENFGDILKKWMFESLSLGNFVGETKGIASGGENKLISCSKEGFSR
jgi:hypothetical protein